jgi:hypothetical protein
MLLVYCLESWFIYYLNGPQSILKQFKLNRTAALTEWRQLLSA